MLDVDEGGPPYPGGDTSLLKITPTVFSPKPIHTNGSATANMQDRIIDPNDKPTKVAEVVAACAPTARKDRDFVMFIQSSPAPSVQPLP